MGNNMSFETYLCCQVSTGSVSALKRYGIEFRNFENTSVKRNDDGVMIETFALNDGITYGTPRTFIKNNRLKYMGKPMIRKSTRRKQKYVTCIHRHRY